MDNADESIDPGQVDTGTIPGGIVGGFVAGIAMALVAMILSALGGQGFWFPLFLVGATFFGVKSLVGGVGVAVVGAIIHLFFSASYGAIFSMITRPQAETGASFFSGIVYSVAVWLFMTYAILPWSDPVLYERVAIMPGWFFVEHLVYGAVLCVVPNLRRRYGAEPVVLPSGQERKRVA